MRKVTKQERSAHNQACELLAVNRDLAANEIEFVLANWNPLAAGNNVGVNATFFTPMGLCRDVAQLATANSLGAHYLDLCAGIGGLTWWMYKLNHMYGSKVDQNAEYTCIEINPEYVAVGMKLMPWARWICSSAFNEALIGSLDTFDMGVSNPPFGKIPSGEAVGLRYTGRADLQACEVLARLCRSAYVILPGNSLPWDRLGSATAFDIPVHREYRKWRCAVPSHVLERTSIDAGLYEFPGAKGVKFDVAELAAVEE